MTPRSSDSTRGARNIVSLLLDANFFAALLVVAVVSFVVEVDADVDATAAAVVRRALGTVVAVVAVVVVASPSVRRAAHMAVECEN